MELIIVESPTKAKTLGRFLGKDYSLEATMGHIKDLPKSKLGIDTDKNFKPDYQILDAKKESIGSIKKEAKKANGVYLATDPDREGEAIAKHVEEILISDSKKPLIKDKPKRIVFHEITKSAVERAIGNPRGIDANLVDAQIARRVLDRLVGYKLSPLLWKKVRRGLSAGRVQSVTVRLIVEKEREIEVFKPDEYWEIFCNVVKTKSKDKSFIVRLAKINKKTAEVKNKKRAGEIVGDLEKAKYVVNEVKRREVKKNPYAPFTTSTMSQSGARLFGWSAKKTMAIAQRLYEEGLITYHRTDSTNISKVAIAKTRKFIESEYGKNYLPEVPRIYKTKSKIAQEAHEAIRPTKVSTKVVESQTKYGKDTERLYSLIWKRFVACQMGASVYDETRIDVDATRDNSIYTLRASGQIMKFDGWRKVIPPAKDEEPVLPTVEKDDLLDLVKVDSQQKFTQPPARFNEASLIKTLEKLGIGIPSTYAPIISTIQLRNYVEKEEKRFHPTTVGVAVNDFLVKNFEDVLDYSFTAQMEDDLDAVATGEKKWEEMMKDFYTPFEKKLDEVEESAKRVKIETEKLGKKCPDCKDGELVIRIGRFGKFISCSKFPECKYTDKYVEKIGMKCPECGKGDVIIKITNKKRRKFFGCSAYPKCKWASWKKPVKSTS